MVAYPEAWANGFGSDAYQHEQAREVAAIDRDGQWDVSQPGRPYQTEKQIQPSTPDALVEGMPAYDPDAEVASLTLTIPTWRTSIERVRSTADMQAVSGSAKAYLRKELDSLTHTIEALRSIIREE